MKHSSVPLVIGLGAILIGLILIFYFFVYIPKQTAEKQDALQTCLTAADKAYNDNWTQACNDAGDAADCKLFNSTAMLLDNRHEQDKTDCYRQQ